jgi:hypothetical protein
MRSAIASRSEASGARIEVWPSIAVGRSDAPKTTGINSVVAEIVDQIPVLLAE